MKNHLNFRFIFLALVSAFFVVTSFQNLNAQNIKKNKVRLKADYVKIMDGDSYIDISATSKIDKKNTEVSNIDLIVFNEFEEDEIILGNITTNMHGKSRFILNDLNIIKPDSINVFNFKIIFKGDDAFKKASKRISFKDANIEAKIITKYAREFTHLFSLWAVVSLHQDSLPSIKEFAKKYSDFMEEVKKYKDEDYLSKVTSGDEKPSFPQSLKYYQNSTGARTEGPQRRKRNTALESIIFQAPTL